MLAWLQAHNIGFNFLNELIEKPNSFRVPIILFIDKCTEEDRLTGLENGADGCITKPFSSRELEARVKALLRTNTADKRHAILAADPVTLDPNTFTVTVKAQRLTLVERNMSF